MRDHISFVLNGRPTRCEGFDPTQTVLRFLREQQNLRGTKEGCAEGDCGACTAVVATLSEGRVRYRPVNTCIHLLGMLDGRALLTIESLQSDEELHPIQQAMISNHGSQCGYCTPGIIMSLLGAYRSNGVSRRRDIDDALAGNLCRCTGYKPIIAAARSAFAVSESAKFRAREAELVSALAEVASDVGCDVRGPKGRFIAPADSDELGQVLAVCPDATIVAGATDVGLWITKKHAEISTIVSISNTSGLCAIAETADDLTIGAAVTYADAVPAIQALYPEVGELARRIAGPQVRAVGTIGGNISNGSPIGDTPPMLIALGAEITIRSVGSRRRIALEDFFIKYGVQNIKPGEYVELVHIPKPAPGNILKCYKISKRFDQDISTISAAFCIKFDAHNRISEARIAFGGMAEIPFRAVACENVLRGQRWSEETIDTAGNILDDCLQPLTDWRGTREYRRLLARNLLRRAFYETAENKALSLAGRVGEVDDAWLN